MHTSHNTEVIHGAAGAARCILGFKYIILIPGWLPGEVRVMKWRERVGELVRAMFRLQQNNNREPRE